MVSCMDPIRDPKLPAISTRFLHITKYLRKKEMAEAAYSTIIKGRLPHPPVLSATADLEKSHANKDAAVRKTTLKMLPLRHDH
jgi:hypothetical protein